MYFYTRIDVVYLEMNIKKVEFCPNLYENDINLHNVEMSDRLDHIYNGITLYMYVCKNVPVSNLKFANFC